MSKRASLCSIRSEREPEPKAKRPGANSLPCYPAPLDCQPHLMLSLPLRVPCLPLPKPLSCTSSTREPARILYGVTHWPGLPSFSVGHSDTRHASPAPPWPTLVLVWAHKVVGCAEMIRPSLIPPLAQPLGSPSWSNPFSFPRWARSAYKIGSWSDTLTM